jgi:cytochrome P450
VDSLHFGHGKSACPGRWFASNELKLMLAIIIRDYDIALPEGETVRPPNIIRGTQMRADTSKQIRLRKRP